MWSSMQQLPKYNFTNDEVMKCKNQIMTIALSYRCRDWFSDLVSEKQEIIGAL